MGNQLLNRRQFNASCAAFGLSLSASNAMAAEAPAPRTVTFPDGTVVPALGQGSWHLGQGRHQVRLEEDALRTGIDLGMTVIDTSENYGDGRSEEVIGRVIAGRRERVFVVTKVEPHNVSGSAMARACDGSLKRLGSDYIDLYLLHGPVAANRFPDVVAQMEALFGVPDGNKCATNQVLYNLRAPYIERDMLPWCTARKMPVMAYSPLGGEKISWCVIPGWRRSALRMASRMRWLRWPGSCAAETSLLSLKP